MISASHHGQSHADFNLHAESNLAGVLGVPCRFLVVVLGVVSHVTGDGGLQDFPGVKPMSYTRTKGRDFLRRNMCCLNIIVRLPSSRSYITENEG